MRASLRVLFRTPAPGWEGRVIREFDACSFVKKTLNARVSHLQLGEVDITIRASEAFQQQNGYFHAGVTTTLADTAGGFAAFTLFDKGHSILTTELKINLLNAAKGDILTAKGRVIKSGKTLSIVKADVYCYSDAAADIHTDTVDTAVHVATMTATMINVKPLQPQPTSMMQ